MLRKPFYTSNHARYAEAKQGRNELVDRDSTCNEGFEKHLRRQRRANTLYDCSLCYLILTRLG